MTIEEERDAIERVLGGEADAFEALVLENQKRVYNLALKMTKNEQDALDISQEAFLKAYTGLKSFRGDSRFSVWLYRLTYNLCLDHLRRASRRRESPLQYTGEDGEQEDIELPDVRALPEDEAERKELREAIARGFEALPEEPRRILTMREIAGMSYADIAAALDISEGTVKSRISRARQRLVSLLGKDGTFSCGERHYERKEAFRND